MRIDLSFIPIEIIPHELKNMKDKKIEYPYDENISFEKLEELANTSNSNFLRQRVKYRLNYISLERNLLNFARELYKKRNLMLAKQCLEMLENIGGKIAESRELLLKIYKRENDIISIKKEVKKIENELNFEIDFLHQFGKLKSLKKKYINYSLN